MDKSTHCPSWGALQGGYDDKDALKTIDSFVNEVVIARNCTVRDQGHGTRILDISVKDLSQTYNHIPADRQDIMIHMIKAGKVDRRNEGQRSD